MTSSKNKQILGLIGWFIVSFAASSIGAIASTKASYFYGQLTQPEWAPPAAVFGPVWTLLYALMAVAAWFVWRSVDFAPTALPSRFSWFNWHLTAFGAGCSLLGTWALSHL